MATAREPYTSDGNRDSVETIRRHQSKVTRAYLLGILHDATIRKTTYRISQKSEVFVKFLAKSIKFFGNSAWFYREGKNRNVWIVEFSKSVLTGFKIRTKQDKVDYIRGYFDAEGGIAKSPKVRFYLYFAQKNLSDLEEVKSYLEEIGVKCGKTHNPSRKVDPEYWRFYIKACSYQDFALKIGSYHPEKSYLLRLKR